MLTGGSAKRLGITRVTAEDGADTEVIQHWGRL